jgi:hypothetical protein
MWCEFCPVADARLGLGAVDELFYVADGLLKASLRRQSGADLLGLVTAGLDLDPAGFCLFGDGDQHGYLTPYRSCISLPSQIIYCDCDRFFITLVPHWCKRIFRRS